MNRNSNRVADPMEPVVVIGGGLAGLTAGAELARGGRAVCVLESARRLGGRAQTVEKDGFRMNLGPRALYAQGAGRRILDRLGVAYQGRAPSLENASALIRGEVRPLPLGPWALLTCSWMSLGERIETARFLAKLPKMDAAALADQTATEWLEGHCRRPNSRALIEGLLRLTTYSADLDLLRADVALDQLRLGFQGVLYIDGGWRSLVSGLRRVAEDAGAEIRTGQRVRRVERHGTGWLVETAAGESVPASAVVLAVTPEQVLTILGDEVDRLPAASRSWIGSRQSVRAACLDIALNQLPRSDRAFAQGLDVPYYVSVHSKTADLAPKGGALIHVARYLRADEDPKREALRQELEGILEWVQPGWRVHEVHRQFLPTITVAHDLPAPGRRRAGCWLAEDLFLAGDWVGDEGLLADAAIASGRRTADAILRGQPSDLSTADSRRVA